MDQNSPVTVPQVGDTFYRYDDSLRASLDHWEDSYRTHTVLEETKFTVVRTTPKGVWVERGALGFVTKRAFILLSAKKRLAYATKEEALQSLIARKNRQADIYRARAADADKAKAMAESRLRELVNSQPASCVMSELELA